MPPTGASSSAPGSHALGASEPGVVTPLLYRAVLGAGASTERYLAVFERLDATGRALPSWNWAAALCPPGWLAFRRLWWALAAYLAVLAVLAGALFFLGHAWLHVPWPMLAGLGLAVALLACGVPGWYGDALLHAQVQRRMRAAVAAAPSLGVAIESLRGEAAGPRRLAWVAGTGAALVLAALAVWGGLQQPVQEDVEVAAEEAAPSTPVDQELPAPAPVVAAVPEPLPAAETSAPPAPAVDPPPVAEPPAPEAPPPPQAAPALAPPAAAAHAPTPRKEAAPRQVRPAATAAPSEAAARSLYINVGLFANPANARRAHQRLREAGLPATVSEVRQSSGRTLQRVRVGPFASAAQANAAAAKVRGLGLDAVAAVQE